VTRKLLVDLDDRGLLVFLWKELERRRAILDADPISRKGGLSEVPGTSPERGWRNPLSPPHARWPNTT
jgi:hypothetical protein